MLNKLALAEPCERSEIFEHYIESLFKTYLQMDLEDCFAQDRSFFEQGLTSLAAMEIKQTLEEDLQCEIDSSVFFNFPTMRQVTQFLMEGSLADLFQSYLKRGEDLQLISNQIQGQVDEYSIVERLDDVNAIGVENLYKEHCETSPQNPDGQDEMDYCKKLFKQEYDL